MGGALPGWHIETFQPLYTGFKTMQVTMGVIEAFFTLLIVSTIALEVRLMVKKGKAFWVEDLFGNIMQVLLECAALCWLGIRIFTYWQMHTLLLKGGGQAANSFLGYELATAHSLLPVAGGVLVVLSWIRLISFVRHARNMKKLLRALAISFKLLKGYFFLLLVLQIAFSLLALTVFGHRLHMYHTFAHAMAHLFAQDPEGQITTYTDGSMGSLLLSSYQVVVMITLFSVAIGIIVEARTQTNEVMKDEPIGMFDKAIGLFVKRLTGTDPYAADERIDEAATGDLTDISGIPLGEAEKELDEVACELKTIHDGLDVAVSRMMTVYGLGKHDVGIVTFRDSESDGDDEPL